MILQIKYDNPEKCEIYLEVLIEINDNMSSWGADAMNHQSLDEDKGEHVDEMMDSKDTTKNKLASNNISQKLM